MYATERQRQSARAVASSVEEWLRSLEIAVQVEPLNRGNLARATQLLNKTNQMNLRTRRLTEAELREWAEESGRAAWTVRVADRFGDYGLTGLVSVESGEDAARLADFVLSCRVFGRKIEETMIHIASVWARQAGLTTLEAHFSPTPKNKPCLEFFEQRSGFARSEDGVFRLGLREAPAAPDAVALNTIAEGVG
jgi:FkbH-like protein